MCNSLSETVGQAQFLNRNTNIDSRRYQLLCNSSLELRNRHRNLCRWRDMTTIWRRQCINTINLGKLNWIYNFTSLLPLSMSCEFSKHDKFWHSWNQVAVHTVDDTIKQTCHRTYKQFHRLVLLDKLISSVSQEIPPILSYPQVQYNIHKRPPHAPILIHINTVHVPFSPLEVPF